LWQREIQLVRQRDEVIILYMQDHQIRRVRMDVHHPAKITPTWHGDSVGHYEGDVLVVDTIGVKVGPYSMADRLVGPAENRHLPPAILNPLSFPVEYSRSPCSYARVAPTRNEHPPSHNWITSSARSRIDRCTVRPSIFSEKVTPISGAVEGASPTGVDSYRAPAVSAH
jgi:hypothetical protein